ncbi:MAG: VOC family protein [Flavobacteriia bacterium]|nr:VOC family protein [Flavobacteriia bacterium]
MNSLLSTTEEKKNNEKLKLGNFSMSLSVKDLKVSQKFYEDIGFEVFADHSKDNYVILKNGKTVIGLFQGFFSNNILTFNPGWDENAKKVKKNDDIRIIEKHLLEKNIKLDSGVEENSEGPGYFTLTDPDGNAILFDQHF